MSPTGHEHVHNMTPFPQQSERNPLLRVFVIFFHPTGAVTAMGGAEKRFVQTLRFLAKREDLEFTVLESAPSLLINVGISCRRYSLSSGFQGKGWLSTYVGWFLWIVKAFIKSLSLLRHVKTNVVFIPNNTLPNLISGYAISRVLHLPLYVVTHHIDTPFIKAGHPRKHSLYSSYRSIKYGRSVSLAKTLGSYATVSLLKKAKGILTVSNSTAKVLRENGVAESEILVSGNAVDIKYIENARRFTRKRIYDGVFVGRISKEKGIFDLLEVWKEVVRAKKDANLLIIGSGLELPSVKEEIVELGLENRVFVRGPVADTELYGLLDSSRIFIFPSVFEGWGIAVAEALACGLPVIAYDIPALREVFGNCKSVFLVPVKNLESMTSTVLDVLAAGEKKLCELGCCSKVYSRQFSWEKIATKDLELFGIFS